MKRLQVICDGSRARVTNNRTPIRLGHRGRTPNVNLSIESPSHKLLTGVSRRSADLIKIAAYVYAADQSVSRGGSTDVYGDTWRRDFLICLPVSDRAFWSRESTREHLGTALRSVSDDTWRFQFSDATPEAAQLPFHLNPGEALGEPDSVFLFSGGLDSLCAVVEAARKGAKPLLVGHSPAFHIQNRQRSLASELRLALSNWHFPYVSMAIHRATKRDPADYTQRTRSFLYAAVGAVIAYGLGLPQVHLPDNGVVSVNLPINDQLFGAKASRSTHPRFLRAFSDLASLVFRRDFTVVNPLSTRTRAETLEILKAATAERLLASTNSCSHPRSLSKLQPHCGTCSQCIDRRFATLATGLEEYDPGERYALDIFLKELPVGNLRTMALSYVRFGQEVANIDGETMFAKYPQLLECVDPNAPSQRDMAEALTDMIRRHGQSVVRVLKEQIEHHSEDLAGARIPDGCLLRLAQVAGEGLPVSEEVTTAAPQGVSRSHDELVINRGDRSVELRGVRYSLTDTAAQMVTLLYTGALSGRPDLTWEQLTTTVPTTARSMSEVFRTVPEWRTLIASPRRGVYRLNLDDRARLTA